MSPHILLGVMRGDLIACGQPHTVMPGDVVECPLEIFLSERLVDDEWVETQRHYPSSRLPLFIELIELVDHNSVEILACQTLGDEHCDIVEFDRVRD